MAKVTGKVEDVIMMDNNKGGRVIKGKGVHTHIHQEVVAKIAGLAVREVEGIHELVPFGAGQTISNLANRVSGGMEMRDLGVRVEVGTEEAAVDVRVVTNYGASIPAIADAVFKNVSTRILDMTGLKVVEVKIEVLDLWFSEDDIVVIPEATRVK